MMAKADDSIVPSNEQIQSILIKSRHCWQRYVKQATEQPSTLLDSIELRDLLDRVPAIPHGRRLKRNGRTVYGQSTWNFKPQNGCNLGEFTGDLKPLTLGIILPTICSTEGSCFHHWRGDAFDGREAGNSLAILTFAWAYILSARLVEIQGESIRYTEVLAPIVQDNEADHADFKDVIIDIGKVDSAAVRWWRAILAYG
jgi:hypothetical protein